MAAIALLVMMTGYVTEADYRKVMDSWIGNDENTLISKWGPPNRVYEIGDAKYLTYDHSGSMTLPGTSPTYPTTFVGNTAYTNAYGGSPPSTVALSCSQTFRVEDHRVVGWTSQGNNCY
jgi:hypothetical protein